MELKSYYEFKKQLLESVNEASYSAEELEKADDEVRKLEIELEKELKSEHPDVEEQDIFDFIDDLSGFYVGARKYEELKSLISDHNEMRNRFKIYLSR